MRYQMQALAAEWEIHLLGRAQDRPDWVKACNFTALEAAAVFQH
jgi:hypothetical protein